MSNEAFLNKPVTTIGRAPENDVVLPHDSEISRRHAEIRREGPYFVIYDLGSVNGTFVNEEQVSRQRLREGDEIRVGNTRLLFQRGALIAPGALAPKRQPAPSQFAWIAAAGVVLVLVALAVALFLRTTPIEQAQKATVMVIVPDDWDDLVSLGSGSMVDPQGLVLTNFHVIGDLDTGDWYNSPGYAYIGITSRSDRPPVPWYLAEVVQGDIELDLAVLRIVADKHGDQLRKALNLATVPIGDSESVNIGDKLSVLGYPEVGMWSPDVIGPSELDRFQATMTYAEGTVSGFFTTGNVKMWIKTDAELNEGNSGGMAINGRGELVGIPTWSAIWSDVGGIRPSNLARHVIEAAQIEMENIP